MSGSNANKDAKFASGCEFYIGDKKSDVDDLEKLADSGTTYIKITVNKDGKATKIIMAEDKFQDTSKVNATYRVKTITDDYIRVMEGGESVEYSIGSKSDVAFYVWDNKNNRFDEVDFDEAEEFCDSDHKVDITAVSYTHLEQHAGRDIILKFHK